MRTLIRSAAPLVAVAALLGPAPACTGGFAPQYLVKDLRVLAVRTQVQGTATTADATPGDTVFVDALVVNPLGRPGLGLTWYGCVPIASEALLPCLDPAFLSDPGRLAAEAEAPPDPSRPRVLRLGTCAPDGDGCGVAFPVPPQVQPALDFVVGIALADPAFSCRAYTEMPIVAVAEASGARQLAVKRLRIRPKSDTLPAQLQGVYELNLNPTAEAVVRAEDAAGCAGGTPVGAVLPVGPSLLCGARADTPQEFATCDAGGPLPEPVEEDSSWQWYATAGEFPEFDGNVGNVTGAPVEFVRPPGTFTLWGILRDGRGGADWIRRDVGAAP